MPLSCCLFSGVSWAALTYVWLPMTPKVWLDRVGDVAERMGRDGERSLREERRDGERKR